MKTRHSPSFPLLGTLLAQGYIQPSWLSADFSATSANFEVVTLQFERVGSGHLYCYNCLRSSVVWPRWPRVCVPLGSRRPGAMTREGNCFLLSPHCAGREALRGPRPCPRPLPPHENRLGSEPVGKLSVSSRPRPGPGRRHTRLPDLGEAHTGGGPSPSRKVAAVWFLRRKPPGEGDATTDFLRGTHTKLGRGTYRGPRWDHHLIPRGGGRDIRREARPPAAF